MRTNKDKIKAALKKAKVSQVEIAEMLSVSAAAVNYVVSGKKGIPRIRKAISMAVGRPISDLWPENQPQTKDQP